MERSFEFVETETIKTSFERKDSFEFRADKKHHRIQKICFWILRKIGAYRWDSNLTYKKHTINPQSFMERLFKQNAHLQREFGAKPSQLFIGSEDFASVIG